MDVPLTIPTPTSVAHTNAEPPAPFPVHCAFSELRTSLRATKASLASDVDNSRV
ncbi:hypothetical protein AZE42_12337 [Rhizopogon vesiculosus]|uniref:Uncharacterized protein n=1 Tax=Rhizopogon vesiculosus TaxID=180088 RepID=A0A1J8Q8G7_9AGAM|nr:hypothetical protein AZE42_12337 [Rhizopogon vesiculosus]